MPDAYNKGNIAISVPVVIVLIIGIIVGVYLVQKTQIFKPKAFTNAGQTVEVTVSDSNSPLSYDESANSFETNSRSVKIKLKPETLEELKKVEEPHNF